MSRGFLSGVIWGGVVGTMGLAVASQVAPPPRDVFAAATPGALAPAPQADSVPPAPEAPAPDAPAEPPATMTAPTADELSLPPPGSAPQPAMGTEPAPAAPPAVAEAEAPPAEEPSATAATDLAPPPGSEFARPLPEVDPVLPGPETGVSIEAAPVVVAPEATERSAPDTQSARRPDAAPLTPAAPQPPEDEAAAPAALPGAYGSAERPAESERPGAPDAEAAPQTADLPPPPPLTEEERALLEVPPVEEAQAPQQPALIQPDPPRDSAAEAPAPGLPATVDGVKTGRLPRIGDVPAGAEEAAEPAEDLPPVRRFARSFDNPDAKPLFSVLLIDTGGPDLDREALAALPFPVSFVIDPLAPGAATAAAIYRAAGQEVLMLATGIPEGATASDLEVTFQSHAKALPEAVGVIDLPSDGFQANRVVSTQVAAILGDQGRGIVTHDRGLNAADQVAQRTDLPAALVFRRLDGEGEATPAIRRYLDRAAFKAAQEGRVTVLGETRPETVQALLEWSVEGRSASVALAPVTAVMSGR